MKTIIRKKLMLLVMLLVTLHAAYLNGQITPEEAIIQMQKGINLGNTLEPPYEAGWNNPKAEEYYFDLYKSAGFQCVRVPVRWDNHTQTQVPYKIDEAWLNRVEQVLDWGLERDLFIVVNAHHDNWIKENYENASYRARFDSIWSQISTRFKDKSEKLIFEVLNEPHGLTKAQNDDMHARILSIIRKSNPTRLVIFQGHNWGGSDELLTMAVPEDEYVIGSFHSYDPYEFGLQGKGKWGSSTDINQLHDKFKAVKTWSDTHGMPVFLGEFGSLRTCDYNSRMKHYKTYVEFAKTYGFTYCAWDDGGDFRIMEREQKKWDEVKDILIYSSVHSPRHPSIDLYQDTIMHVSWRNATIPYDRLLIQRKLPFGEYTRVAAVHGDTTDFYDAGLAQEKYYHYRIIAISGEDSLYSHPVRAFLPRYIPKVRSYFLGEPLPVPGLIEAEHFDAGGEGLSFHDADERNVGGAFRQDEAVDIYDRLGEGYHIGNALPGEWYEYTVDVESRDTFNVHFHVASIYSGGKFQMKIGEISSDTLTVKSTSSWLETDTITTRLLLEQGTQVMRFTIIDDPLFNLDKIEFKTGSVSTSIDFHSLDGIRMYNSSYNQLVVINDNGNVIERTRLYSITGSLIQSNHHHNRKIQLNMATLKRGVYIVQVYTSTGSYARKILVGR